MNNRQKVIVNIFIFVMIAGFVGYIIRSVNKDNTTLVDSSSVAKPFVSDYERTAEITLGDTISAFDVKDNAVYVLSKNVLRIYNQQNDLLNSFPVKEGVRDMKVQQDSICLLYPASIEVYSLQGDSVFGWEACSDLSDYCSFTFVGNQVFVTDAGNKNICKYTTDGSFKQFIRSPHDFITPSHAFDITSFNDTIYCVNPGRHLVESYTTKGDFIASFGWAGMDAGFFSGCCNPGHIAFDQKGQLFTSEKGLPRISLYSKDGVFKKMVLNHRLLGGGYHAHEIKVVGQQLWVAFDRTIGIYELKR